MEDIIPLFPLGRLPVPDMSLRLQIFEPRYLDLVSRCMRKNTGFGIVLIREGCETEPIATFFPPGLYVKIIDWQQQDNGLLGITVKGAVKFTVRSAMVVKGACLQAKVQRLPEEPIHSVGVEYRSLLALHSDLMGHPAVQSLNFPPVGDARQLGWQLLELLPLTKPDKATLFALENPTQRLRELLERIAEWRGEQD